MRHLRLEVVCPSGAGLVEKGLDEVVFRRREEGPGGGSLISILPRHGWMLAQSAAGEIAWRRGPEVRRARAGAGVVEVFDGRVLVLASDVERVR